MRLMERAMPYPCKGARVSVLRMSMSSVPGSRSGLVMSIRESFGGAFFGTDVRKRLRDRLSMGRTALVKEMFRGDAIFLSVGWFSLRPATGIGQDRFGSCGEVVEKNGRRARRR